MQRIHVFTTIGLICGLTSLALTPAAFITIAVIYGVAGYMSSIKEVSVYTSIYQFVTVFATALLTGIAIEYPFTHFPLLTLSMFFCAFGSIGRITFFQTFTLTGNKWLEPSAFLLSSATWIYANLIYNYSWQGWVFPGALIAFQSVLMYGIYIDQKQLNSHAIKGYKVQIGTYAPDFKLPDQNGINVSLSDYKGKRHLLLIFVRGDWCPSCHMMLRTYARNNKKFQEKNIFVMAIGPDPIGVNREMVMKLGVDFKVLSDEKQRTAMQYGVQLEEYEHIFDEGYEEGIPLPASFLVDINGIVQYVSRPDRVGEFLDPSKIFPIIDNLS